MTAPRGPQSGDIIVRQEHRDDGVVYVLHTASRPDQMVVRSRDEAVAQALAIAARQRRRAWFTNDAREFTPLDDRVGAPTVDPPPPGAANRPS